MISAQQICLCLLTAVASIGGLIASEGSAPEPPALASHGYFFVGGKYYETDYAFDPADSRYMASQMYVEFQIPKQVEHPYPIVMIHGAGMTHTNFLGTPDGREGWADFFLKKGYRVYLVDQPGRGESGFAPDKYPVTFRTPALRAEQKFTAPEFYNAWPQARLHTQWPGSEPGKGRVGDPIFDQFYASTVPYIGSMKLTEQLMRDAGAALLDKIGPSILLTHSQGGLLGWVIADARPKLVKGILAVEPGGPPMVVATKSGDRLQVQAWGLADIPLAYDPPLSDSSQLHFVGQNEADGPGLQRGVLQAEPARKLSHLQGIPILILTGEASYHAQYDHCTVKYLAQAGVDADFIRLENVGIHGNGHMMMLEKNSLEIADFINRWAVQHIK